MNPIRKAWWVCLLLVVPLVWAAPDEKEDLDRIVAAGRSKSRVMDYLDTICNRFGPRLTGSDNLLNACAWTRETFEGLGLANARVEKWGEYAVGFNRGPWSGRMVKPVEKTLHFGTNAWTAGTKGVQKGPALFAPVSEEELAKVRERLPGAWVLMRRPGSGRRASADLRQKLREAYRELGIAGTVQPTGGELIMTGGAPPGSWDKLPTTPAVNLLKKEYDEIAGLVAKGEAVELEFDIRNWFKKGPVPLQNVIADLPGGETPDEVVIVGGHLDSWDGATGAMDNGTGCAATIEAARILMKAGVKPRRTVRFMLPSGEEQGLLGSRAYVRGNPELMKKISAVLVHDGGTNYVAGISATEPMVADFEKVFAPVKALDPQMPFQVRKVGGLPPFIGSDQDSFLGAGVPGFYLIQKGRANYNRIHHTQFDTYDGAIPEYQRHSALVMAIGAYGIANLDHLVARENLVSTSPTARGNRRRMGVQLDELKVTEVTEGSVAAKAGLKEGDVFVKLEGKKVSDREELTTAIQAGEPKKTATVLREGKEMDVVLEWPKPQESK